MQYISVQTKTESVANISLALTRTTWSLLNQLFMVLVLHRWGLAILVICECNQQQTTNHIGDTI